MHTYEKSENVIEKREAAITEKVKNSDWGNMREEKQELGMCQKHPHPMREGSWELGERRERIGRIT